jgi:hypothetical protein
MYLDGAGGKYLKIVGAALDFPPIYLKGDLAMKILFNSGLFK